MSRFNQRAAKNLRSALVLFCGGLFIWSAGPTTATGDACGNATAIELNTTGRHFADRTAGSGCFEAYVPTAGLLMIEVTVPATGEAEARIEVHGPIAGDRQEDHGHYAFVDQLAASLLLKIRDPGRYRFRVEAQDPERGLGEYKLGIGFAEAPSTKEGDPEEDEPDPDPQPITGSAFSPSFVLSEICLRSGMDDHGDSLRCASPLSVGEEVTAEIGNEWGDDDDFFTFVLSDQQTIRIMSAGLTDTFGTLYDERGYRLKSDDGGTETNFRIVKTLSPGRYFVRVTGRNHAQGSYRLIVEALGR